MKLVAVARVKNEADIIEPFVRHHIQHFDKVIVLDDGSTDGTHQLLRQLQSTSRDLVVLSQPTIGYMQHAHMTMLLRMAADSFGADWIAPLDADEFIEPTDGLLLAQILADRQPAVYRLAWSNFIWTPSLEESGERNPVLRQRFRLAPRMDKTKLVLHAQFVSGAAELGSGNHFLTHCGRPVPTQPLDEVQLCHYPVRSIAQYAGKIAIGHLQYLATPNWDRGTGFHYIKPFQELANFGLTGISKLVSHDSLFYSLEESEQVKHHPESVEAPLNYLGGPLTLKPPDNSILSNVLRYAEMVAVEFAEKCQDLDRVSSETAFLRKRLSELETELRSLQGEVGRQARQLQSRTFTLLTRIYEILIRANILRPRP